MCGFARRKMQDLRRHWGPQDQLGQALRLRIAGKVAEAGLRQVIGKDASARSSSFGTWPLKKTCYMAVAEGDRSPIDEGLGRARHRMIPPCARALRRRPRVSVRTAAKASVELDPGTCCADCGRRSARGG